MTARTALMSESRPLRARNPAPTEGRGIEPDRDEHEDNEGEHVRSAGPAEPLDHLGEPEAWSFVRRQRSTERRSQRREQGPPGRADPRLAPGVEVHYEPSLSR